MGTLADNTAVRRTEGGLSADLSRNWEIWGPNGGYVASIALRAAGAVAPEGHRPASLSCQYLSVGAFGPAEIVVEPVKQGRSAWCLNVALSQEGRTFLRAQVWTVAGREGGPSSADRAMPEVPRPHALRPMEDYLPKDRPRHAFWENFEARPTRFLQPGEADPRSVLQQWSRYKDFAAADADPFLDAARSVVLIDTLQWPAHCRGLTSPPDYIAPSLDLSVWFHQPAGDADWLLADVHADTAAGGLIHGGAAIWTEDGRLIATGASHMLQVQRAS